MPRASGASLARELGHNKEQMTATCRQRAIVAKIRIASEGAAGLISLDSADVLPIETSFRCSTVTKALSIRGGRVVTDDVPIHQFHLR